MCAAALAPRSTVARSRTWSGSGRGQLPPQQVQDAPDRGDRLADLVHRGGQEVLAHLVDMGGDAGDRGGDRPVEGVVDQHVGRQHVRGRGGVAQVGAQRVADLLAQQAELGDDIHDAQPLLHAIAGVLPRGQQDGRIVQRGLGIDPARRAALQNATRVSNSLGMPSATPRMPRPRWAGRRAVACSHSASTSSRRRARALATEPRSAPRVMDSMRSLMPTGSCTPASWAMRTGSRKRAGSVPPHAHTPGPLGGRRDAP